MSGVDRILFGMAGVQILGWPLMSSWNLIQYSRREAVIAQRAEVLAVCNDGGNGSGTVLGPGFHQIN